MATTSHNLTATAGTRPRVVCPARHSDRPPGTTRSKENTMTAADPQESPGSYFPALAESEQAGTTWTCRCGTPNPGTWDTCQECQHPGNA